MTKIETLDDLEKAAQERKSVIIRSELKNIRFFSGRMPAAFVINMSAREVLRAIRIGLYIYEKEKE